MVVATINPLSHGIDAARGLILGRPVGTDVAVTLAICLLIWVLGMVFATWRLRRAR